MKDKIIRGITEDKYVRFFAVDSTETVREAKKIHNLSITNSVIMGRAISAALILGVDLKSASNVMTLKIDGDGNCGHVIVTSNNLGEVKAYMRNPEYETPLNMQTKRLDIKAALGNGTLTLIKDLGMKQPYDPSHGKFGIFKGSHGEEGHNLIFPHLSHDIRFPERVGQHIKHRVKYDLPGYCAWWDLDPGLCLNNSESSSRKRNIVSCDASDFFFEEHQ